MKLLFLKGISWYSFLRLLPSDNLSYIEEEIHCKEETVKLCEQILFCMPTINIAFMAIGLMLFSQLQMVSLLCTAY